MVSFESEWFKKLAEYKGDLCATRYYYLQTQLATFFYLINSMLEEERKSELRSTEFKHKNPLKGSDNAGNKN